MTLAVTLQDIRQGSFQHPVLGVRFRMSLVGARRLGYSGPTSLSQSPDGAQTLTPSMRAAQRDTASRPARRSDTVRSYSRLRVRVDDVADSR
eukprot:CAMPEP_0170409626 /NCGR_PEP_ID=MMETSP0117_2-20130122/29444_1 /TAXON_ID=400756 /ORGANISM="Durinskia baltica, Strain CSIRO CS-38" /LENGTH=91 /DNA_ID=CAMNT_0010667079 /DNA_START=1 /DNA_END=274 /DNA_ORIENTATION=+